MCIEKAGTVKTVFSCDCVKGGAPKKFWGVGCLFAANLQQKKCNQQFSTTPEKAKVWSPQGESLSLLSLPHARRCRSTSSCLLVIQLSGPLGPSAAPTTPLAALRLTSRSLRSTGLEFGGRVQSPTPRGVTGKRRGVDGIRWGGVPTPRGGSANSVALGFFFRSR